MSDTPTAARRPLAELNVVANPLMPKGTLIVHPETFDLLKRALDEADYKRVS